MTTAAHLAGNLLALGLGVLCAACVVRMVSAFMAQDRKLVRLWLLRAVGAGAGCLGVSTLTRSWLGL